MNKKLALRTFSYLIGHYKTHEETIINSQEIEAIEFILKNNEELEQQVKNQKKVINKAIEYINENLIISSILDGKKTYCLNNYTFDYKELLDILKEVSE